jgi:hypothetical protein
MDSDLLPFFAIILGLLGSGLLVTLGLMTFVIVRIRRINIPQGAGFLEALRHTPLVVAIVLDLLDFTFDFLSAPIAWTLLTYLGLQPLRGVTVLEALIPGTQLIPTMTLSWLIARYVPVDDLFSKP